MKIKAKNFLVKEGKTIKLSDWPTQIDPLATSKREYKQHLQLNTESLSDLQRRLYASNRYALLLIFQGMDCSGKDGVIKHVLSGLNPQGVEVFSFKQPSSEELQHDFLWRTTCRLPERGRIGVFNRSYYEEVLVVKVHQDLLHHQGFDKANKEFWSGRYRSILDYEAHLHRNHMRVLKFYLHLSFEEQRKRLLARIDEPDKNWKMQPSDIAERKHWKAYMRAYEDCLSATSTKHAPWFVIPADDKETARLIVSTLLLDALTDLDLAYPKLSKSHQQELANMRQELMDSD